MWDVWDVGVWDVRCLGCGKFGMWDDRDVGCSGYGMFGMWDLRDMGCLPGCGMLICKMSCAVLQILLLATKTQ